MTFRALVIDALERALEEPSRSFRLRDASVGTNAKGSKTLSASSIDRAIDRQRNKPFQP
jgi:hypothetical protein